MSQYEPDIVPEKVEDLVEFLVRELRNIANLQLGITYVESLKLAVLVSEPHEVYTGLMVYADGTLWDPGSGEGVYVRDSSPAWIKL